MALTLGSLGWYAFIAYLVLTGINIYQLLVPKGCVHPTHWDCLPPSIQPEERIHIRIFAHTSTKQPPPSAELILDRPGVDPAEGFEDIIQVPLKAYDARTTGSLMYAHVYFMRSAEVGSVGEVSAMASKQEVLNYLVVPLSRLLPYQYIRRRRNLLSDVTGDGKSGDGAATPAGDPSTSGTSAQAPSSDPEANPHSDAPDPDSCAAGGPDTCPSDDLGDGAGAHTDPPEEGEEEEPKEQQLQQQQQQQQLSVQQPEDFVEGELYPHLRPSVELRIVSSHPLLSKKYFPQDLRNQVWHDDAGQIKYRPLVQLDELELVRRHWVLISRNGSRGDPLIPVTLKPTHIAMFRVLGQVDLSLKMMQSHIGLSETDVEDVKEMMLDLGFSWKMWAMTFVVGTLHSVFAFLAFKNDVGFWKQRTSLEGLSIRAFFSSFLCQAIILLKLLDAPNVSVIILAEVGIGTFIEGWKVTKIMRRRGMLTFEYWLKKKEDRTGEVALMSALEQETDEYDKRAMRFLGYLLYPVVACFGLYSLVYHAHRGWWSWFISTLANGVYMFGFIAMCPQLYVNYRLESVAHLPWRAFMYKAFNTFVDDVFAFAISMPLVHRVACLRDDVVFFVYLYQMWLYPIDKTRANEFGRAYADEDDNGPGAAADAAPPAALADGSTALASGEQGEEGEGGGGADDDESAAEDDEDRKTK